jgi:hypothetical protein
MQITKDITPLAIADKLLLEFDATIIKDFDKALNDAGFTDDLIDEYELIKKVVEAKQILVRSLKYIIDTTNGNNFFILTDNGLQAKKAGGHNAHILKLEAKELADKKRQERKDKSEELDLLIKEWQVKTKYLPYIFSTIALIGTGVSIYISIKALNYKKDPADLQQVQQKIQQLQERVNKQDSLFRLNIHQIEDK